MNPFLNTIYNFYFLAIVVAAFFAPTVGEKIMWLTVAVLQIFAFVKEKEFVEIENYFWWCFGASQVFPLRKEVVFLSIILIPYGLIIFTKTFKRFYKQIVN